MKYSSKITAVAQPLVAPAVSLMVPYYRFTRGRSWPRRASLDTSLWTLKHHSSSSTFFWSLVYISVLTASSQYWCIVEDGRPVSLTAAVRESREFLATKPPFCGRANAEILPYPLQNTLVNTESGWHTWLGSSGSALLMKAK
jgi:hypothetical protein